MNRRLLRRKRARTAFLRRSRAIVALLLLSSLVLAVFAAPLGPGNAGVASSERWTGEISGEKARPQEPAEGELQALRAEAKRPTETEPETADVEFTGLPEYRGWHQEGTAKPPSNAVGPGSSVGAIPAVKPFNFGRDPGGPEDKTLYLTIPKLDLEDVPVFDTVSEEKLKESTVHVPATGFPWQKGANTYIAGHRIGYPNTGSYYVFYHLDQLEKGDEIILEDAAGDEYLYHVNERMVVGPDNVEAMNAVEGRSLVTLQTCTLPDYEKRLVIRGELAESGA